MNTIILKRKKKWMKLQEAELKPEKLKLKQIYIKKVRFYNYAYEKSLHYWKTAAWKNLTQNEARELIQLAPRKVILVSKAKNQKFDSIEEIVFYLKSQYLQHNAEDRTFISDILCEEPSFEAITDNLKTFFKLIKEHDNRGLKNKSLIGGWLIMAAKIYRRENLSYSFEDWLYKNCGIKRHTSYSYRNLYRKLMKCRVNTTFF